MENCELNNCTINIYNDSEARRKLDELRKDMTKFCEIVERFKLKSGKEEEEVFLELVDENDKVKDIIKKTFG